MSRSWKNYILLFGVAGVVVALDQWTKWLVRTHLHFQSSWLPQDWEWLSPYARIVYWENRGAAFGMFQSGSLIFTVLAFVVIAAILYYYPRVEADDWPLRLAMGLQMGGALGNLIDRLTLGGPVTDFISIGRFPVFNIADSSITVGVIVLILGVWWKERHEDKAITAQANEESPDITMGK